MVLCLAGERVVRGVVNCVLYLTMFVSGIKILLKYKDQAGKTIKDLKVCFIVSNE